MALCRRCTTFMIGVGIGGAAGILLAPKSGREIRQELFGGQRDVMEEPGTEFSAPMESPQETEDLKARIEETRARLKAEIEAQQDE